MSTSTRQTGKFPRVAAILLMVAGVIMLFAGAIAWTGISSQLKAEDMTVSADAGSMANKPVAGPISAWSQQAVIHKHVMKMTEGRSYAEMGEVVDQAKEKYGEKSDEALAAQETRTMALNGSLLRSSLLTSVLSFGVAFLVMGLGISTGLTGAAILQVARGKDSATE